jgi:HAE1 family hydrophobic/amphiphilic exporter-1
VNQTSQKSGLRKWLPALAVRRPVTILMALLALLVMGALAWVDIPVQMMPSGFDVPYMWVQVPYPGSTPLETDQKVVSPIAEQLATVPGIKRLGSNARAGSASFSVELQSSTDMDQAYNSIADRLERAMVEMPEGVDDFFIWRFDPADSPVVWAGLSIDPSIEDPAPLVLEGLVPELERLPGVAKVDVYGIDEKEVYVDFDRDALLAHAVNLNALMSTLGQDNFQMASGRIQDKGRTRYVRSLARYESLEQLRQTPVAPGIALEDVATVHYRIEPGSSIWRIDGQEAAGIAITKESSANAVQTCRDIVALLESQDTPGLSYSVFFSQGELIEDSINNLLKTALQGGLFAVIILFIFLREIRMTLLIAASIPLSLLITVTVLYFTGGSLNLLSLMGLMIAVGMVVDNAIVVVETIYRRRQAGLSAEQAAIDGTAEVNLAITLSTATTMVVFLPLILMSQDAMFSFFMGALGFPVVFALAASLLVALVFTPLSTVFLKNTSVKEDPKWIQWLAERYSRLLRRILTRRFDTGIGVLAVLVLTVAVPFQQVGCTDQADGNLGDFEIGFELPPSFGYSERLEALESMEKVVIDHKEDWGVRVFRSQLNSSGRNGEMSIYLDEDMDEERREEIRDEALAAMPDLPGVRIWSGSQSVGASAESSRLVLYVEGEDPQVLTELSDEMIRRLRPLDIALSVESGLDERGSDEIQLQVDRAAAAKAGISATAIGQTLSFAMGANRLPDYHDDGHQVNVMTRFQAKDRADLDTLLDFPLYGTSGSPIPLRALTDVTVTKGFGTISRQGGVTSLPVNLELAEGVEILQAYVAIEAALDSMELPRGYAWTKGRRFQDQMENDQARNLALLLSVTFVFLLMGVLFESFVLPLSIVTTIPMALVGVYWTLYLTGTPLDVMGGVGLVVLIGVVVNNGIVLVDLVTQLRADGVERQEALIQAGKRRMRPILMTALTTIFGLLPMALGTESFVGIPYAPLARVVAGGMAAATVLTLFFVPYLYVALDDARALSERVLAYAWPSRS